MNIKTTENINAGYELTTSYVALTAKDTKGAYQVRLDLQYTMGSGEDSNTCELYIETANPNGQPALADIAASDWVREKEEQSSMGVITQSNVIYQIDPSVDNGKISISLPSDFKFIRLSAKETGVDAEAGILIARITVVEDNQY